MTFREIRPLTMAERAERAQWWPIYTVRLYLIVRRSAPELTRIEAMRLASWWFHSWVWNYVDLPW